MKHLLSCLKSYKKEVVLAPLFKMLEATLELIVPLIVARIIDVGIASGDRGQIVLYSLLLVAFGLVGLTFALTAQYFSAKAAVNASADLRERLFQKLHSFSYAQIDKMGTSTMITRMTSDINQVQTGINMTLRLFLRSPFIVFGAMIMAFTVDWKVALTFVAVIPLLAIVVFTVMAVSTKRYRSVQNNLDKVYLSTRENLAGVRVLRAFCQEEEEEAQFSERNEKLCRSQKWAGVASALTNPLTYVLVNLAVIALVWLGGLRVNVGALEQGQVVALYSYLSQILVELVKLANLIVTITKAIACQKRIGAVLDLEGEAQTLEEESEGACPDFLQFDGVSYAYEGGGEPALQDISFSVKKGQTIGILGGTGAGKSTLVNLIPRFYHVTEGKILLNGRDVNAIPLTQLREQIGMVPQKAVLFQGTIRSNLLWGKGDATDEQLLSAVKRAQAEDVLSAKGGLDGEVAQEGKNFSGGQRQRLTIARALVKQPEILILDDSASALDYATDRNLRRALKDTGSTVFIVSQRTASVRHADLILVLDDGKIVGSGTHETLLHSCEIYQEIYHSQFGGEDDEAV